MPDDAALAPDPWRGARPDALEPIVRGLRTMDTAARIAVMPAFALAIRIVRELAHTSAPAALLVPRADALQAALIAAVNNADARNAGWESVAAAYTALSQRVRAVLPALYAEARRVYESTLLAWHESSASVAYVSEARRTAFAEALAAPLYPHAIGRGYPFVPYGAAVDDLEQRRLAQAMVRAMAQWWEAHREPRAISAVVHFDPAPRFEPAGALPPLAVGMGPDALDFALAHVAALHMLRPDRVVTAPRDVVLGLLHAAARPRHRVDLFLCYILAAASPLPVPPGAYKEAADIAWRALCAWSAGGVRYTGHPPRRDRRHVGERVAALQLVASGDALWRLLAPSADVDRIRAAG